MTDFNQSEVTPDEAKQNFVYLYLCYNSLSYTRSTETPVMDVVSLMANIGGTLGLFLGLSMLHVCELMDVLIEYVFFKLEEKNNRIYADWFESFRSKIINFFKIMILSRYRFQVTPYFIVKMMLLFIVLLPFFSRGRPFLR